MPPKKSTKKADKGAAEDAEKPLDDREIRKSIDQEAAMREQIANLTNQLEGVLEKAENTVSPDLSALAAAPKDDAPKKKGGKAPKKKVSLKDGPKRTISVQLPPEVFEEIQRDELRDDLEINKDLKSFLASQGLDPYLKALQRRGFKTCEDLGALNEGDLDFDIKLVHKTRILWIAETQKSFLETEGGAVPAVEKIKPTTPDEPIDADKPDYEKPKKKPGVKAGGKPSTGKKPSAKPGSKPSAGKKPSKKPSGKPAAKPGAKPSGKPTGKPKATKDVDAPPAAPEEEAAAPPAAPEEEVPPAQPADAAAAEVEDILEDEDDFDDDPYPIIEGEVVGIVLPPQPPGVTRLIFGSGPFGITVYGTGNGLVVTHVEPEGSGADHGIEVGDHIVELNGIGVAPTISDREFVEQLMSLSRPVILGFTRNGGELIPGELPDDEETNFAEAAAETLMIGGISMDELDPEKELKDIFPGAGLGRYVEALSEMGAEKMEDLAYLRRSDLQDMEIEIHPADKKKLLELGLVAFLTKEGLGECVAYIRSVGVDMVDDLVYLRQSDVSLMDLSKEHKDKLMDVLGREN